MSYGSFSAHRSEETDEHCQTPNQRQLHMLNECPTPRSIDSLTPSCVSRLLAMIIHSRYCLETRISVVYGIDLALTCPPWYFVSARPGYAGH